MEIRLRTANASDLQTLAAIEQQSFPDPSWTESDFLRYDCTVAEVDSKPVGFIVSRETYCGSADTPPEREILNLAVAAEFRRRSIGSKLIQYESQRGADLFLEVRESNAPAIHLYRNAGFTELSLRRDYYENPRESAIVMRLKW